jgi:hypothetical protein
MSAKPLLFMPFLHKEFCPAALPFSLLQLWPGLPNPQQGFYVPAGFPLTPQDAAYYLDRVEDINFAAADKIPVHSLLAVEKQMQHAGMPKEAQDISAFAQGGELETAAVYYMREAGLAAQKALLRIWLFEERCLEIQALEQHCHSLSGDLDAALGAEWEEGETSALLFTQNTQRLAGTIRPAVPWRFLLENAALFLPEYSTLLFADKSICSELREFALPSTKVQAELYLSGQTLPTHMPELAEAPLWKALGMKGARPERPWLAKTFSFLLWDEAR